MRREVVVSLSWKDVAFACRGDTSWCTDGEGYDADPEHRLPQIERTNEARTRRRAVPWWVSVGFSRRVSQPFDPSMREIPGWRPTCSPSRRWSESIGTREEVYASVGVRTSSRFRCEIVRNHESNEAHPRRRTHGWVVDANAVPSRMNFVRIWYGRKNVRTCHAYLDCPRVRV